jgi:hypothetical protein
MNEHERAALAQEFRIKMLGLAMEQAGNPAKARKKSLRLFLTTAKNVLRGFGHQ